MQSVCAFIIHSAFRAHRDGASCVSCLVDSMCVLHIRVMTMYAPYHSCVPPYAL